MSDTPVSTNGPIGHHNGYAADQRLSINPSDGLNESELQAVVSRSIARIETIRQVNVTADVPVTIQSRADFRETQQHNDTTTAFRRFDNAKFEAMFLVGEQTDSLAEQKASRGSSVLGYYSYENDSIVIVSDSDTPTLSGEGTLAHELTHALQDQQHDLSSFEKRTRDEYNAVNGLIEGEANLVQRLYTDRCNSDWNCLRSTTSNSAGGGPDNWGIHLLNYFPYGEGAEMVTTVYENDGWDGVSALYENPPESAEQVIHPESREDESPVAVSIEDRNRDGWQRVRLDPDHRGAVRPDHAVLGQSALTAMFARSAFDSFNRTAVVTRNDIIEQRNGRTRLTYSLPMTDGWAGDRFHVYHRNGQTGYVWKLVWDDRANATTFVDSYERLLSHWGGEQTGPNTWTITRGPFRDAFSIRTEGTSVTIVNGPDQSALSSIRPATDG